MQLQLTSWRVSPSDALTADAESGLWQIAVLASPTAPTCIAYTWCWLPASMQWRQENNVEDYMNQFLPNSMDQVIRRCMPTGWLGYDKLVGLKLTKNVTTHLWQGQCRSCCADLRCRQASLQVEFGHQR